MTGAAFEVVFDDVAVLGALDRLEAGLTDTTPLLQILGEYGVASTMRRFDDQAAPDGVPWKGLSKAYAEIKSALGGLPGILRFSGHMAAGIHFETDPGAVRWGSGAVQAAVHQFGATIVPKQAKALAFVLGDIYGPGQSGALGKTQAHLVQVHSVTIPERPYLGLSVEDGTMIEALTEDWVRGLLG